MPPSWSARVTGIRESWESWPPGYRESFTGRPSLSVFDENGLGKGSGRSIEGLSLVEALNRCAEHLEKFGGHEMAAGLTMPEKNLPAFSRAFQEVARELLSDELLQPRVQLDHELTFSEINCDLLQWHECFSLLAMEMRSHCFSPGEWKRRRLRKL